MLNSSSSILALDIGDRRIGVAVANAVARIAHPLKAIDHTADIVLTLKDLLIEQEAAVLVLGLPRNLDGQHTEQTRIVETFASSLKQQVNVPIYWQDEALTSHKAEAELQQKRRVYHKGDIDALAATYILEDFLHDHPEVKA